VKKVLIITYYWPPSGGAGVQRWLKFAKYLPEFGWEPHIYTPSNPEAPALDESLIKDIPPEAVIIKKPIFEPYTFYKKFTGKKGKVNAGFLSEDDDSRKKLTERISIWIRGNLFIPDARVFWVRPSVRFLSNYIKENQIDTIITTGPPHSMHLIGFKLKQKLKIRWIADFRDPWTNIDFYKDLMLTKNSDKKHHKLERKVVSQADEVIAIGKTMAQEFESVSGRKVQIITNGFDVADYVELSLKTTAKFEILHVGSINADRNHRIFWQGLRELCNENSDFDSKLHLKFVGKLDYVVKQDIEKYNFGSKVEFISYIPHNEVVKHFSEASILYLPLNNTPNSKGVLTGKFFEYLTVGKSIIGIGDIEGDAQDILAKTNGGTLVDFNDIIGFKKVILKNFNSDIFNPNMNEIEQYSRKNLTQKLVNIINKE
jgi:glycosyltransferase involved in cell wall biosynthesis